MELEESLMEEKQIEFASASVIQGGVTGSNARRQVERLKYGASAEGCRFNGFSRSLIGGFKANQKIDHRALAEAAEASIIADGEYGLAHIDADAILSLKYGIPTGHISLTKSELKKKKPKSNYEMNRYLQA